MVSRGAPAGVSVSAARVVACWKPRRSGIAALLVRRIATDLHPLDGVLVESESYQRSGRFRGEAAAGRVRADPETDLEDARALARMQSETSDHAHLVRGEEAVEPIATGAEVVARLREALLDHLDGQGVRRCPRQPLAQLGETAVDGVLQQRSVRGIPAAQQKPCRGDPVEVPDHHAQTSLPASSRSPARGRPSSRSVTGSPST